MKTGGQVRNPALGARLASDPLKILSLALKRQWKRYRKELKRCQHKFSEKAIHASRIETRRLLAIIELLESFLAAGRARKLHRSLKRYLDTFDNLRDTQVQLMVVGRLRRRFAAARPFHDYLVEREERFTRKTKKKIESFQARRLQALIAGCRKNLQEERERMDGRAAIGKLLGSVQSAFTRTRRLRARIRPENTSTIHRTRVAFKHFRYMVEGLSRFLPGVNEKRLRKMREYQAMMGDIQDMEVLLQALDKFIGRKKVHSQSAQRLREEVLRWRLWLIRIYLDVAGQLEGFWDGKAIKSAVEGRQRNNT